MDFADSIFSNGDIITMTDSQPAAEALAVKDGRILAVGSAADVAAHAGPATKRIDLGGKTLLPGFLDGHSHFINAIRMASWANLSAPPVGKVRSIADLIATLQATKEAQQLKPGQWLIGYGYDGTTLADGRELTRADLDPHFPENPVVAMHVSLHGAVLNTAAFEAAHIGIDAPAPEGGMTARIPGTGEAAGLLMEHSFLPVYMNMPAPSEQEQLDAFETAQKTYAGNGYTTAQDAPMEPSTRPLYHKAADQGRFFIDFVGFLNWLEFPEVLAKKSEPVNEGYSNRFRVGGVKIVADGSPQGKTAYWTQPLLTPGPGGEKDWRGEPNVTQEDLNALIKLAYDNGIKVWTHCNGDAAIDMMLEAHAAAGAPANTRTTIIHSQFVRPEQLDKYVEYGFLASFFTNHAYFWGDVHVENLGKERAYFLSPTRSAKDRGISFSNHSDFAVTPLNPMFILWTSVSRTSRSGQIIGAGERLSPHEGLRALTIDAAYQYGEEREKGTLEPGKLADLVVLDRNPTKVPVDEIKEIEIVETFKEGASVFRAAG